MVVKNPKVFDWKKYRELNELPDDCLWKLALEQWYNGHDPEVRDSISFVDGFYVGWIAHKAVEKSI